MARTKAKIEKIDNINSIKKEAEKEAKIVKENYEKELKKKEEENKTEVIKEKNN